MVISLNISPFCIGCMGWVVVAEYRPNWSLDKRLPSIGILGMDSRASSGSRAVWFLNVEV